MHIYKIIGFGFGIIFLVLFISGTGLGIYSLFQTPTINEVKCFDRFANEIIGQVCEEEEFPFEGLSVGLIIISLPLAIVAMAFWFKGDTIEFDEYLRRKN